MENVYVRICGNQLELDLPNNTGYRIFLNKIDSSSWGMLNRKRKNSYTWEIIKHYSFETFSECLEVLKAECKELGYYMVVTSNV